MIHPTDIKYRAALFYVDGGIYAIPKDHPISTDSEPIIDRSRGVPNTFVELAGGWDRAAAELAVRLLLDEWHLPATVIQDEVSIGEKTWLSLRKFDADGLMDERLSIELDKLNLPDTIVPYLDVDQWVEDQKERGRGWLLAPYDGIEHTVETDDEIFLVFRLK